MTRDTSAEVREVPTPAPDQFAQELLECALRITRADFGNVQLVHPDDGSLRIVAHSGFEDEFLQYFAVVDDEHCACGRAAQQAQQVVVGDVSIDPQFAPHVDIAKSAGFLSVQSTPLVDRHGRLVGMVSTHYARANAISPLELRLIDFAAHLAIDHLAADPPTHDEAHESDVRRRSDVMGSFLHLHDELARDMERLHLSIHEFTNVVVAGLLDLGLMLASAQGMAVDGPLARRLDSSLAELDRIVHGIRRDGMTLTNGQLAPGLPSLREAPFADAESD
jgi:GAF domain